jgi:hypothetical protein
MSGNYGWGGRDRSDDYSTPYSGGGFTSARTPYATPADYSRPAPSRSATSLRMTAGPSKVLGDAELSPRKHIKTTKDNVIIVSLDRTGSMGEWRHEIFTRLALLFKEAQKYLGESLEIVFMGFGDGPACGDDFHVAPSGCGPELDDYLVSLDQHASGGGNYIESAELPAYYVSQQIDTTAAKSVFFFTITDEGFYQTVNEEEIDGVLGLRMPPEKVNAAQVFQSLKTRMNVFLIKAETGCYDVIINKMNDKQWKDAVGDDCFVALDDHRRVVDVMLGVIAKVRGQMDQFSKDLMDRQGSTHYGSVNIATVSRSISMVKGAPASPSIKAGTKSLLAPDLTVVDRKPGTKSLLS